jgi:prevent-host-death family protein
MNTPIVISVSELRRDTARLIERARRSPDPLYISQRGYITAVLLPPERYEELRDAARSQEERARNLRLPLRDRRVLGVQYGPCDWETARLVDAEDEETEGYGQGEECGDDEE